HLPRSPPGRARPRHLPAQRARGREPTHGPVLPLRTPPRQAGRAAPRNQPRVSTHARPSTPVSLTYRARMLETPSLMRASTLVRDYAPEAGVFDEIKADDGSLRPHWRRFFELLDALGPGELAQR